MTRQHADELIIACDPDGRRSALAWAVSREPKVFDFTNVAGGGTGSAVGEWQTITGMSRELQELSDAYAVPLFRVTFVCETQAPDGPRSTDVEGCRRVRYHAEAACEVLGVRFMSVDPKTWMPVFCTVGRLLGAGAMKVAYQRRAKELTSLATNEDRCAAVGMLWWYVNSVGAQLVFDR